MTANIAADNFRVRIFKWLLNIAAGAHAVFDFFPEVCVDDVDNVEDHQTVGGAQVHLDRTRQARFVEIELIDKHSAEHIIVAHDIAQMTA